MSKVSKVTINALPSSVIFSQGKREVTVGRNHLPLISGVISAVYTAKGSGIAPMGIARNKAFTSLAIPAGYKGRDKLLGCAKDSAGLAAGKKLVARNGSLFKSSDDFRDIALAVVKFVNDSKDFKKVKVKTTKTGVKAKKGNNLKKFRVDENGKLVRLSRGKPSPFWTIVEAPENAQDSDAFGENGKIAKGFKVLRKASNKVERVKTSRKAANSKQILALETEVTELRETLAKILAVVEGNAKLLESIKNPTLEDTKAKVKAFVKKAKDSKKLKVEEKTNDSAKLEAMSDLVNDNADMANIVTQL
jgi:hypothetical protein